MGEMRIRDAGADDLPFLEQVRAQMKVPDWWLEGWPRADDVTVIAEDDAGDRIGAAWCRPESEGTVTQVIARVEARHRRKGTAEALLRALADRARDRGVQLLHATVSNSNEAALELALKVGFVQYSRNDDSTQLVWNIGEGPMPTSGPGRTLPPPP